MEDTRSYPLHEAVESKDIGRIRSLLNAEANVNEKKVCNGDTPLHLVRFISFSPGQDIFKLLISAGADVNLKNAKGETSFKKILRETYWSLDKVQILINTGADVNTTDTSDQTALHIVSKSNKPSLIEYLLSNGAHVNRRNRIMRTALHEAAVECKDDSHFEVIKTLLNRGANINVQDRWCRTPLHYLVYRRVNMKTVKLLLNFKAPAAVNIKDRKQEIPLLFAIRSNNSKIVQTLVDRGSDVNSCTRRFSMFRKTPLLEVCRVSGSKKVAKILLKNGANTCSKLDFDKFNSSAGKDILRFILPYTDINELNSFYCYKATESVWKIFLQHLAILQALDIPVNSDVFEGISDVFEYRPYLKNCAEELEITKTTKPDNSWISFFNLLVDSKRRIKNYAGNEDMVSYFKNKDCSERFPIYGATIHKKVMKGIKVRELFDKSAIVLSDCLPIFNPNHLIVTDILDCMLIKEDLFKFSR